MTLADDDLSIAPHQPTDTSKVEDWVEWFWTAFLPGWVRRAHDPDSIGFFDLLDQNGQPAQSDRRTLLAQARLLFTFSHLALLSDNAAYHAAAQIARDALSAFAKGPGLYRRSVMATGQTTGIPSDELAYSYDQSFVILGLSTWGRLHPDQDVAAELEACWITIETTLTDPATGLMLEHDGRFDPSAATAPNRAQNPHMHLYEAALQAHEMTGKTIWLTRAAAMRAKALTWFFDTTSGTITEFLTPDLSPLPNREGTRREVGHQCEWAWLLLREVDLGGDPAMRDVAARLLDFADRYGFATDGPLQGAAFDAIAADTGWRENTFLLWPQTEAIKTYAVRAAQGDYGEKARSLTRLLFRHYFAGRAAYANQLDEKAQAIWPDALSRLHYHVVLALTEGARAGLWPAPR